MDKKALPTHVLPTRDPPQNKRPTQIESGGLEKNIPSKHTGKKAEVAILMLDKMDLKKKKAMKKDPGGHFIILKGKIHQEDINIVNIYVHPT